MKLSVNLYETIKSLELAHQRRFDVNEIKTIIANYYRYNDRTERTEAPQENPQEPKRPTQKSNL